MVKRLRRDAGLSQTELARRVGVTSAYISLLEKGDRKNPSLAIVKKLARALNVDVAELLK